MLQWLYEEELGDNINEDINIENINDKFRVLGISEIDRNVNFLQTHNDAATEGSTESSIRAIKLPPLISESDFLNMISTLNANNSPLP